MRTAAIGSDSFLGHAVVLVERVAPHVGADWTGLDERDRNLPGAQLDSQGVSQRFDRILGGVVGAGTGVVMNPLTEDMNTNRPRLRGSSAAPPGSPRSGRRR